MSTISQKNTKLFVPHPTEGYWDAVIVNVHKEHDFSPQLKYQNNYKNELLRIFLLHEVIFEVIHNLLIYSQSFLKILYSFSKHMKYQRKL